MKRAAVIEGDDASPEAVRPTIELIDRMIEIVREQVDPITELPHDFTIESTNRNRRHVMNTFSKPCTARSFPRRPGDSSTKQIQRSSELQAARAPLPFCTSAGASRPTPT